MVDVEREEAMEVNQSRDLLWDCFVNWSLTLEKTEKGEADAPEG
jgi:hypothetical protein